MQAIGHGISNLLLDKVRQISREFFAQPMEEKKKYVIARQLLKSGTAIGANVHEAQNAESKADFIHKFKLAAKEIEETKYWLLLCERSSSYPDCSLLTGMLGEIDKIVTKIISTSKSKQ